MIECYEISSNRTATYSMLIGCNDISPNLINVHRNQLISTEFHEMSLNVIEWHETLINVTKSNYSVSNLTKCY